MSRFLQTVICGFLLLLTAAFYGSALAQPTANTVTLDYYLPEEVNYSENIPEPRSVTGHPVGAWHVRYAQMVDYMYKLAKASDRVSVREIGRTYEQRPLIILTITSPSNHARLEQLRERRMQWIDPESQADMSVSSVPAAIYMGYSIHGDEASGTSTALVAAYHLAAAQGKRVEKMLQKSVILLDPSMNPDGYSRYAQWVNSNRGLQLVDDPQSREQNQPWPTGRTNHYWFDLNRDWMLVQHPSSQARIKLFHRWKPNVLTDFHEMGKNATYFFQPGVPSRTHPLTLERNQQLTQAVAEYHADKMDRHDRLYYSKEDFDDFYYGKGSTYPDANGSIGILFEQASSRSHQQETIHGELDFPFAIKNHFLTTRSTLEAVSELREELLQYQRSFFRDMQEEARQDDNTAYVFGSDDDPVRSYKLASLISRHDIKVYELDESVSVGGDTYKSGSSYIVPLRQQQYKMINVLFERRTSFRDSLFYDVSAWTMPMAFNLPYASLGDGQYNSDLQGKRVELDSLPAGNRIGGQTDYAYLFEWDGYYAPRALYRFQEAGVRVKVATRPFEAVTSRGTHQFGYGTIMVPLFMQEVDEERIHRIAREAAENDVLDVYAVPSGLTPRGIDLGSGSIKALSRPKTMLVTGPGINAYEAGQVWHLLDQRFKVPVSRISTQRLEEVNLDRYNRIVMVDGWYDDRLGKEFAERIKQWVEDGGTLITTKDATEWTAEQEIVPFRYREKDDTSKQVNDYRKYVLKDRYQGAQQIGGAIFYARLDTTHPIGYGYERPVIPIFRDHTDFLKPSESPYNTPLRYTDSPLASGYISDSNLKKLEGTASIVVAERGAGEIIGFADNPNFRAFWYGTNKLFANAFFFGDIIDAEAGDY